MAEQQNEQKKPMVGVSVLIIDGDRILLEGKTYPSQTTDTKVGAAIETSPALPGERAQALRPDESNPPVRYVGKQPDDLPAL